MKIKMHSKFKRFYLLLLSCFMLNSDSSLIAQEENIDLVELSQQFITSLKKHESVDQYIYQLANLTLSSITKDLNSDNRKYAFWINIYNAFIQVHLSENPAYYEDRRSFFKLPLMTIAGEKMSFADIEHGILRRSQLELFLGYMSNPFPGKIEKLLRVDKRDHRVHFALNCGAKSCPAIAIYSAENLDKELDYIGRKFLEFFSNYNLEEKRVTTTALFSWFRGDFGGGEGIRAILKKHGIIESINVRVKTSKYDWTLYLDNFTELPVLN